MGFKNFINAAIQTAKEAYEADSKGKLNDFGKEKLSQLSNKANDYWNKEEKEEKDFSELVKRYVKFYDCMEFQQALNVLEKLRAKYEDRLSACWYYTEKADTLIQIGNKQLVAEAGDPNYSEQTAVYQEQNRKAKIALDAAEDSAESQEEICKILYLRSLCQREEKNGWGRKFLIGAMATDNDKDKEFFLNAYLESTNSISYHQFEQYSDESNWNDPEYSEEDRKELKGLVESLKFTNINYANRQLIFVGRDDNHIAGCYDPTDNINWVFTLDYVPSDIKFPVGHPQANTLYIAHPVNKEIYIPYEESEYNFFIDKIHELCHLLQCLGATEITFRSLKGRDTSYEANGSWSIDGEVGVKKVGAAVNGQVKQNYGLNSSSSHNSEIGLVITANPTSKPYCPDDLYWMETETQWKNLVKQRLNGNLLTYEQRISTKSVTNISSRQRLDIKGAFENFMYKVSAHYESDSDSTFKEAEETEWKITAKFKPLEEYANNAMPVEGTHEEAANPSTSTLSDDEQSYAEEVKFCLEDGAIGDKERRFLERMRTKLGISPERAAEIEESFHQPQFTEDEQEYLDAVREELVDGGIPESSRKLLNRLRRSMDISDERSVELEKYVTGV